MSEPVYVDQGALFGPGGLASEYRFRLWREWAKGEDTVAFVMLNPSTADGEKLDPTVRKCVTFAQRWGFKRLEVLNLFALRSTDPTGLYTHGAPQGDNWPHLIEVTSRCRWVVCAWGVHGEHLNMGKTAEAILRHHGRRLYHLGLNQGGTPKHPLYLKLSASPHPWDR
jgi:hypothetical protein